MSRALVLTLVIATAIVGNGRAQIVTVSPFRCDLSMLSAAERARKDVISGTLAEHKLGVKELADGYEFQFPGDGATIALVSEWVVTERLCCPFFDFDVRLSREGGALSLRLTGRPGTKTFIQSDFVRWMK
jgi:hypothetical protein